MRHTLSGGAESKSERAHLFIYSFLGITLFIKLHKIRRFIERAASDIKAGIKYEEAIKLQLCG
jgi:hypothetical protein